MFIIGQDQIDVNILGQILLVNKPGQIYVHKFDNYL